MRRLNSNTLPPITKAAATISNQVLSGPAAVDGCVLLVVALLVGAVGAIGEALAALAVVGVVTA